MANVTYPAGIATAYGAAVRGGYTGTYDDFCRQQAQYADSAAAVEQAKEDAETAASEADTSKTAAAGSASAAATSAGQASTSATNAANSATEANASKNAAATSATEAGNSATAAAGSASDAQNSADDAQASAEAAAQSAASVDVHADGNYPEMTVGTSEQLLSTQYVTEKTPYLYRTTGGSSDVGNREYERNITGGTVAWNQMVEYRAFTGSGITQELDGTDTLYVHGTNTQGSTIWPQMSITKDVKKDHVYMASAFVKGTLNGAQTLSIKRLDGVGDPYVVITNGVGSAVLKASADNNTVYWYKTIPADETIDARLKLNIFDLTQMFGSTIADYICFLEQANAGAGVAWFRKLFPNDYYPYNAGELKSVEGVSSHEMVGFNQWDEEWELGYYDSDGEAKSSTSYIRCKNYIPVFPSTNYYATIPSDNLIYICEYDSNYNFINGSRRNRANSVFTTNAKTKYLRFSTGQAYGTTYKNDICINLSWSGTHNGEYKPYEKHSYALDDSLTLRGIPKLDNGSLYYDGDVYAPDGTVTRRYGVVDLGTLNWTRSPSGLFSTTITGIKPAASTQVAADSILCQLYTVVASGPHTGPDGTPPSANLTMSLATAALMHFNNTAYTDAAAFKAAMSGVYLVYELATPATDEADPYTEIQICDDWGTEEYVSTSIVPVGHTTDYPANLRDKLQHLPDLASADGNYIVSQSGTQMTLAPLPIVIPAPPTTDGTYTFRATVSNGVPTLSWVEE